MRGDRPVRSSILIPASRATPHARGSTHAQPSGSWWAGGYPACAGIDLEERQANRFAAGLPRMRGDRPHDLPILRDMLEATPHARGSTCVSSAAGQGSSGYPACAGIDP